MCMWVRVGAQSGRFSGDVTHYFPDTDTYEVKYSGEFCAERNSHHFVCLRP